MNRNVNWLMLIPLFVGCDLYKKAKNTVDGLTNPLVAQAMILGVEAPDNEEDWDLTDTPYGEGTSLTAFLADAKEVGQLEEVPVSGAEVKLNDIEAQETVDGTYTITNSSLDYEEGAEWSLNIQIDNEASVLDISLPPSSSVEPTPDHDANTAMTLDFSNEEYHGVILVVMTNEGGITWSNRPETIRELYDFGHGSDTVESIEIPAEAFPDEALYLVGIAGMRHTSADDISNANTALSSINAGQMKFSVVSTLTN